jgi:hypothetical protein
MAIILLLFIDLSTFYLVLQVLLCVLMPRHHPLMSTSFPAINCVLLIATSTLQRHPLHGYIPVRRGRIPPLILNL